MLVVKLRPRSIGLQTTMLPGVEQTIEIKARRSLVLRLQDRLGVVQADPPNVLGERAVSTRQSFCSVTQPTVCFVDLLDQSVFDNWRLLSSSSTFVPPLRIFERRMASLTDGERV